MNPRLGRIALVLMFGALLWAGMRYYADEPVLRAASNRLDRIRRAGW